jgi:hypothetical protein
LHQNAEEGVEALQMHPRIRKVTPQRKVQRFLHFTKGMNDTINIECQGNREGGNLPYAKAWVQI